MAQIVKVGRQHSALRQPRNWILFVLFCLIFGGLFLFHSASPASQLSYSGSLFEVYEGGNELQQQQEPQVGADNAEAGEEETVDDVSDTITSNTITSNTDASTGAAAVSSSFLTLSKPPLQQLEEFLLENPTSPATEFVGLLRQYLHFEPAAEVERMLRCHYKSSNVSACIGGLRNYRLAADKVRRRSNNNEAEANLILNNFTKMEKETRLALYENELPGQSEASKFSVYGIYHYRDTDHVIPILGTKPVCLPLMLAGSVIRDPNSMVVELGPFAGLSSTCIVTGMLTNGEREHAYHAFDTFEGKQNYNAISRSKWVKQVYPKFTSAQTSFLQQWKDTVQYVYPMAEATAGYITPSTLTPAKLNFKKVAMLSIDSAKSASSLLQQLGGLQVIEKGTIIFFMDFEYVREQIKQVYGCLRQSFLLPVYVSWNMEHWAFIVVKDFSLKDTTLATCYKRIAADKKSMLTLIKAMVDKDLVYLSGLTDDVAITDRFQDIRDRLAARIKGGLMNTPEDWGRLAALHSK